MSKPVHPSRFSLRSGAVAFSLLTSLGACATIDTPRHGFATASAVEPAQWGFVAVAAPSQTAQHGYASALEPAQSVV